MKSPNNTVLLDLNNNRKWTSTDYFAPATCRQDVLEPQTNHLCLLNGPFDKIRVLLFYTCLSDVLSSVIVWNKFYLPETAPLQWLHRVRAGPKLQHWLSWDATQQIKGRALAAWDFQLLPSAVCSVSTEHGLHSGPGSASVSSSQVCIFKTWFECIWNYPALWSEI